SSLRLGEVTMDERDGDDVRTCSRVELDVLQRRVDGVDRAILLLVDGFRLHVAADVPLPEGLAVEGGDDVILELEIEEPERDREIADVELISPVGREIMLDLKAAARSERHIRPVI